jgi:two-component system, NtrC family, response regulator PilR
MDDRAMLIAEGEPGELGQLGEILGRRGWRVATVRTGAEAREHLHRKAPGWLLADMRLPDGGGVGLLLHVRESGIGTRVVLAIEAGDTERLREAGDLMPHALLIKPLELEIAWMACGEPPPGASDAGPA